MTHTKSIKEQLITLATIADKPINEITLNAFVDALSDLDQGTVLHALKDWLRTSRGFPYPADIRAKVMPELDDADNAQTVANLIIAAVSKDGYTNPERARGRIGDLGWAVVEQSGGWKHMCDTMTPDNESILKAQLRDLAKTVSKRAKRGELDQPPSLPAHSNSSDQIHSERMNLLENQAHAIRDQDARSLVNSTMKTIGAVEADNK